MHVLPPSQIVRGSRAQLDSFIPPCMCVPYVSRFISIHMNVDKQKEGWNPFQFLDEPWREYFKSKPKAV